MWVCDSCYEAVFDDDIVSVFATDGRSEYIYHEHCWNVEKKNHPWYEDEKGELHYEVRNDDIDRRPSA